MIQNIYRLDIQIIIIDIQTFSSSKINFLFELNSTPLSLKLGNFFGKIIQKQVFWKNNPKASFLKSSGLFL